MKTLSSISGGFAERPYYTDKDIEYVCSSELQSVALLPSSPAPIRIDRFIEKRFGLSHQYEDLDEGVLGLTVFGSKRVSAVMVARGLDAEGSKVAARRIRSTLAHEAGHGLLHSQLFAFERSIQPLFGDFSDPLKPRVLCRDIPVSDGKEFKQYDGRWWEYQANRAMAALLLPRSLVHQALEPLLSAQGSLGRRSLAAARRAKLHGASARSLTRTVS